MTHASPYTYIVPQTKEGARPLGARKQGKQDPICPSPRWGPLTIIKLQDLIVDWRGHANGLARKIRVEVRPSRSDTPVGGSQ